MSVVALSAVAQPVNEELVTMLETLLAQARAGEVRSCAFAAVMNDGASRTGWAHDPVSNNIFTELGVIENLKIRFYLRNIEVLF